MTRATAPAAPPAELEDVRRWRHDLLVRAGYTEQEATMLSGRRDVDVHLAARLLQEGCPRETALRILV